MNYINHSKVKLRIDILKSSINFFINFFIDFFFLYKKMSKNLSAKYYQENKERPQQKLVKDIKNFLKKKEKKQQYGREC